MSTQNRYQLLNHKRACIGLFSMFIGLLGLYMYLVSATVMHVVLQTETRQEIKSISSDISVLENRLIVAQHKVSKSIASLEGFTEVNDKVFIDRAPESLLLSNTNRTQ